MGTILELSCAELIVVSRGSRRGQPISSKRVEARPETELCIRCKEDQERNEHDFA